MDDLEALQFERDWETHSGSKTAAIRDTFGIPAARYYVQLYSWLDDPATVRLDPLLVHRLIRLRDARAAQRARRSWASAPVRSHRQAV